MEYIEEDWDINIRFEKPKGMYTQKNSWVEFKYKYGDILIEYGEEKSHAKNRDIIVRMIKSI